MASARPAPRLRRRLSQRFCGRPCEQTSRGAHSALKGSAAHARLAGRRASASSQLGHVRCSSPSARGSSSCSQRRASDSSRTLSHGVSAVVSAACWYSCSVVCASAGARDCSAIAMYRKVKAQKRRKLLCRMKDCKRRVNICTQILAFATSWIVGWRRKETMAAARSE